MAGKNWLRRCFLFGAMFTVLLAGVSCKKKTPPMTEYPTGPAPAIATSGQPFGGAAWMAQKAADSRNISAGAGQSFAHVTYKPEVKIVDEGAVRSSLVGISSDGHGAVFKNAPAAVLALKAGDIFMVQKQFAVKVLGVQTDGDQTVVIVDHASLADVVQQGVIHLDTPIGFHGPAVGSVQPAAKRPFSFMDLVAPPVYAAQNGTGTPAAPGALQPGFNTPKDGINGGSASDQAKDFLKALTSGWTVEKWSVTPTNNSAAISAKMTKDSAGFLAVVTLDGTVSNFQFAQNLTFPVDTTQVANGVKGMTGQMTFGWEIGKNTPGVWATEDKLKLPAGVTIPLAEMLEGLPLTLDISAALLIHPGLTGGNEHSKGSFTIGWNGNPGDGGLTFDITQDQSISPVAPNAMVISFCVPRVELQLSPMSSFSGLSDIGSAIDTIVGKVASAILPANVLAAIKASPLGNFSVTNALASSADVYVQIIHTEGVTHAANISLAPCSKVQLKVDGQAGGDANLLGILKGSSATKSLFTKSFTRWNPGSDFCKSV
jgi:hypothetical protein